jgi:molybdate transport repressor ModE-like protein
METTNAGSWHGVELRHLAALEAIAKEGSFSGAGARMGYSQSAISGQIATLEKLVGARLVTRLRGSRKVAITPEGQLLLDHAKVINARLSAARAHPAHRHVPERLADAAARPLPPPPTGTGAGRDIAQRRRRH